MTTIHLTTLTDSNFLVPTLVMVTSVKENMGEDSRCCFHIFHSNLLPWEENAFRQLESPRFSIKVQRLNNNQFSHLPDCGRHGQATLMRLNLPNILPDVERVIYLDGDIVVLKDLAELYSLELGDCLLAAVRDLVGLIDHDHLNNLAIKEYFNAGVMLMDLARMRADNIVQRFGESANVITKFWKYADQDVINFTCANRIMPLHPKYNGITMSYKYRMGKDLDIFNAYHKTQYTSFRELENEFALIHWAGNPGQRPWEMWDAACSPIWFHYLHKSPLKQTNLDLKTPWRSIQGLNSSLESLQRVILEKNRTFGGSGFMPPASRAQTSMATEPHGISAGQTEIKHFGFGHGLPVMTVQKYWNYIDGKIKIKMSLFGFIPLLSARGDCYKIRWRLFRCIPIWKTWTERN